MIIDQETTVGELLGMVREFISERDWEQFHSPKNLSMSIAIEAAELMERFQWEDGGQWADVRDEVADVAIYLLSFVNAFGADLSNAIRDKIAKNAEKYPVDKYKGRFRAST